MFDTKVKELDEALDQLDTLKKEARSFPIDNPAPGRPISSGYGVRKDPLLGTPALHSGIDFRAAFGSDAHATAPGTVTKAGWNGGYGRMVEIDHGNGFSTRYAHLSRIDVKVGEHVATRRRRRRGRQQRPLDRSTSALRSAAQRRRDQPARLPPGRKEGPRAALNARGAFLSRGRRPAATQRRRCAATATLP